jgi:hypothetical protein
MARRLGPDDDLPEAEKDWTSLPQEQVPPWRRADRARLEAARELTPEERGPTTAATAREIRRLADLHQGGALSDDQFVAAVRAAVVQT